MSAWLTFSSAFVAQKFAGVWLKNSLTFTRRENCFLVLQLDDTDFQIGKGYEILEDVRKYLCIPNMIVLMATDTVMLRTTINQHYVTEFATGLEKGLTDTEDLKKLSNKYLDKFMPPAHVVYLPRLDETLLKRPGLDLVYHDPQLSGDGNLLTAKCGAGTFSFQSLVLRYIYQKTGLVFVGPDERMHSVIPTTLRGFRQLLGLLSSMKDAPEPEEWSKSERFLDTVLQATEIYEENLRRFENYFFNDWVNEKLSKEKSEAIAAIERALPEDRIDTAFSELRKLEAITLPMVKDYARLLSRLNKLSDRRHGEEDQCFYTAILICLSIMYHREILTQQRRAVERAKQDKIDREPLLFDFSPSSTNIPVRWNNLQDEPIRIELFGSKDIIPQSAGDNLPPRSNDGYFSPLWLVSFFLSLGCEDSRELVSKQCSQENIYKAQRAAAMYASNPELHMAVLRNWKSKSDLGEVLAQNSREFIKNVLSRVDLIIADINGGQGEGRAMISDRLSSFLPFIPDENEIPPEGSLGAASDIACLAEWVAGLELEDITVVKRQLREFYNRALTEMELMIRDKGWGQVSFIIMAEVQKFIKLFRHVGSFNENELIPEHMEDNETAAKEYRTAFLEQLRELCKVNHVSVEEIVNG